MRNIIKENWESLILLLVSVVSVAYGLSGVIPFGRGIAILVPLSLIGFLLLNKPVKIIPSSELTNMVDILQQTVDLQEQVINDYEGIFDLQLVELPCVCGGNTFEGLFSPKTDNIVECEKCKNKYRVNIEYDAVLITEPLDINQTFDDIVGGSN